MAAHLVLQGYYPLLQYRTGKAYGRLTQRFLLIGPHIERGVHVGIPQWWTDGQISGCPTRQNVPRQAKRIDWSEIPVDVLAKFYDASFEPLHNWK